MVLWIVNVRVDLAPCSQSRMPLPVVLVKYLPLTELTWVAGVTWRYMPGG